MDRQRFVVFWTIDDGYSLSPESDLDQVIVPKFANEAVQAKFDAFFSRDALVRSIGKKIYCDCVVDPATMRDDGPLLIREAHIFAR